jgi:hypothetical protein
MIQEENSKSQKLQATNVEGAQVAAQSTLSASTAGVSGISLQNILGGLRRQVDEKNYADETNHMNTVQQLNQEMQASNNRIESRIASVQRPTAPNPLGFILQGVGGALKSV